MAQLAAIKTEHDYDPTWVDTYPISRAFELEGHQVTIARETDASETPCVVITFAIAGGICSARTMFASDAESAAMRDHMYATLVGQPDLPKGVAEMIEGVWEKEGKPEERFPHPEINAQVH